MELRGMSCCTLQEISNLGTGSNSGKEAMEKFCSIVWGKSRRNAYNSLIANNNSLYAFYVFSSPVYAGGGSGYGYYGGRPANYNYGDEFAKFIRDNKLGKVVETDAELNEAFHQDHKAKVWVWAPDQQAMKAWWKTQQEPVAPPPDFKSDPLTVKPLVAPARDAYGRFASKDPY
jgi:hypothetical protein